jgi:hypothetical protein
LGVWADETTSDDEEEQELTELDFLGLFDDSDDEEFMI